MNGVADPLYLRRRIVNGATMLMAGAATAFGLFWLVWILWTTVSRGLAAFGPHLFTQMTPPPGEVSGGLLNAFAGSLLMCALAVAMATPIGIAAGTYLAEYARGRRLGEVIRFINDILLSAPSIVLGLFVYTLVVSPMGGFSALAGAISLGFIVLPVVVRTTDEMLRLVPAQMREAALSLGIPMWKVNLQILYRAAAPGIDPGVRGRLFDPGAKGPRSGGHGLGLSIVHRLAARTGFTLAIGSQPEGGTRAVLGIPQAERFQSPSAA